ncbi:MAG: endonuclease domain-containing protein [Nanoarchaeota archaeon]
MKYPRLYRKKTKPEKKEYARNMRHNPTEAERILWEKIRKSKLGVKFKRQERILGWIVDFYSPRVALVIELDGSYHDNRIDYDNFRESKIKKLGIDVIRFSNEAIINHLPAVLNTLKKTISKKMLNYPRDVNA